MDLRELPASPALCALRLWGAMLDCEDVREGKGQGVGDRASRAGKGQGAGARGQGEGGSRAGKELSAMTAWACVLDCSIAVLL